MKPSRTTGSKLCNVVTDTGLCRLPTICRGLCSRHYQQDVRGRLGSTKKIAAPGEGAILKVNLTATLKARIQAMADRKGLGYSLSETARALIESALDAGR